MASASSVPSCNLFCLWAESEGRAGKPDWLWQPSLICWRHKFLHPVLAGCRQWKHQFTEWGKSCLSFSCWPATVKGRHHKQHLILGFLEFIKTSGHQEHLLKEPSSWGPSLPTAFGFRLSRVHQNVLPERTLGTKKKKNWVTIFFAPYRVFAIMNRSTLGQRYRKKPACVVLFCWAPFRDQLTVISTKSSGFPSFEVPHVSETATAGGTLSQLMLELTGFDCWLIEVDFGCSNCVL